MEKPRVIMVKGVRLPDYDPSKPIAEIQAHYANEYPELTTATAVVQVKEGVKHYEFKETPHKKG